jgi:DNA-binding response OmpR family regulator
VKRILLVDDDPNILDGLRDILEDAGYHVESAATAAAARETLAAAPVDLVLVDFFLPDGQGPEIAAAAKARAAETRTVLMTGLSAGDIPEGKPAGVDEVLVKPVYPADLLALLGRLLT